MRATHFLLNLLLVTPLATTSLGQASDEADSAKETLWGHSNHGSAYDEGPRQRPWKMEGIGETPFPITSSSPEVQEWFDQGIALMHGFWYYEAERSFRWCLKLDPECAMAYWGMSLATSKDFGGKERPADFLAQAVERMDQVTPRERAYIRVSQAMAEAKEADKDERDEAMNEAMVLLDKLAMDYPDDVEAKALYWLLTGRALGEKREYARFGMESVLDSILAKDPDHVGALHYRVHNWDGKEGHYAIDSCMKLGDLAPGCGHLLHMPGHVLSGIGLWQEAAIAMDRATRVEKDYMKERMIVPENNWDYIHNLHYLGYIQEQLGMIEQALIGADQLLAAPASTEGSYFKVITKNALVRALIKFERWDQLLDPQRVYWNEDDEIEQTIAAYARLRAHIGLGNLEEAEELFESWSEEIEGYTPTPPKPGESPDPEAFVRMRIFKMMEKKLVEIRGLMQLARGEHLEGLATLSAAAEEQVDEWENDPPMDPTFLYNLLGDEYLKLGAPKLAIECYERTLETVFHDGFALAGLVVAHHELGQEERAREAMAKLGVVWSDADRPNRWLSAAEATGIEVEPYLDAAVEQRNYKVEVLDKFGPSLWIPTEAPRLTAADAKGAPASLSDYRGQNVLAIFYLGEECVHCIEQINLAEEHLEDIAALNTVVIGISKDEVEEIAEQQESLGVVLLSDPDFSSARRFHSYDDFEELELHSTFIIDAEGRVHWSRIGGEPFTDFDFIISELQRLDRASATRTASLEERGPSETTQLDTSPGGATKSLR